MPGTWTQHQLAGNRIEVYQPILKPRFALLYLHTYAEESLRDRTIYTNLFDENRLACVCPVGGRTWWTDRALGRNQSAEQFVMQQVVPWCREHWGFESRSLGLFGISMGGQGALRLAFRHPDTFAVVAAISAAIEYHELFGDGTPLDTIYESKEQCRQDTVPMHLHPSRFPLHLFFCADPSDQWWRGNDRLREKLGALGVTHQSELHTCAGGHSWEYFNTMAPRVVSFLVEGLEQQSRRLL